MKRAVLAVCTLLVLVSTSFAAPPSNASLNGTYSFQLANTNVQQWSVSWQCPVYTTVTSVDPATGIVTTVQVQTGSTQQTRSGNSAKEEVTAGTLTFDGKGGVVGSAIQYGKLDQASSIASIPQSCPNASGSGYSVFFPPTPTGFTGTYAILPDGTGSLQLSIPGQSNPPFLVLRLANASGKGVRSTVYILGYRLPPAGQSCAAAASAGNSPCSSDTSGTATLQ